VLCSPEKFNKAARYLIYVMENEGLFAVPMLNDGIELSTFASLNI
jgi:hypothetical protein